MTVPAPPPGPSWYQTAVFYEVPVYAFGDSNGDGVGDFAGMMEHLDYLQWLGVDCIWLLPFYQSPLGDGGYDVSDFTAVLPRYGTVEDVRALLDAAHVRGMRVIADMVLNHTSDQHEWFQRARQPDSDMRDWYVWTDDPSRYPDARVIFVDTHVSNWTWDETAGAWYWHRFFWHQPDLNFDNPAVREAMKDVLRFWLDMGFDGLRLDAVPYLYERDGTNGENLPETHAYLKELRAMVDEEFPDRVLLAEANQWPEEVVEYFGDGDECHMAFHFPVMPRLFLSIATGDTKPITDILAATPEIPVSAQWGVFLRNHDELTLEMVTPEERAYMYGHYAPDPAMRKNVGIRRRLAPLLGNDHRKIQLLVGVLLTLPGSPILYYGDEIGMGDMYLLDDRDGVRTPMQWTDAPGAGFSTADPADFYLPLVDAVGYTVSDVNVADQRDDPTSLLEWTRGMLAERRRHPFLPTAGFIPVETTRPGILAFERRLGAASMLVVANFTDTSTGAVLDVADPQSYRGVLAGTTLDVTGVVSLGPYGFDWLVRG